MNTTDIHDLPIPGPARSGWPWTEQSEALPATLPGKREWPRISIVTPSFNQAEFLEQTIRSVLLQRYPNLEYMIIDGGSNDGSAEIISRYSKHLAYHVSESDRSYIHAINKGFERATGDIICWLNSDDYYLPGTLRTVAETFSAEKTHTALVGHVLVTYSDGSPAKKVIGNYSGIERLFKFWKGYQMHQPSIFWRREVFESVGYLNEDRDLIADFDYWVRIGKHYQFTNVDQILSCATHHPRAKTADGFRGYHEALKKQATSYWGSRWSPRYWRLAISMFGCYRLRPLIEPVLNLARPYYRAFQSQQGVWHTRKRNNA
ncbi:MAG TPA: glycosyltransferase family 2 protein [Pyrinomonadaceae bacterium]